MPTRDRRSFLRASATLGTTLVAAPGLGASPAAAAGRTAAAGLGRRTLGSGKHSLEVSSLGLGCMGMSHHRSFIPERKASIALSERYTGTRAQQTNR